MGGISDVDTDYQAMVTERRYGHEEETRDGGIEGREYGLRVQGQPDDGGCARALRAAIPPPV